MAITPRSFRLNPTLLIVAVLAAFGLWCATSMTSSCPSVRSMVTPASFGSCDASSSDLPEWTPRQWGASVSCLLEADQPDEAYRAASLAALFHPTNSTILNLKGYAAARNGEHGTAILDFRHGLRVTGSPNGIFENNIAWTTLFRTDGLRFQRQERLLRQTRALYEQSLRKGWSCERAHTALFVEYKYADLLAQNVGTHDPRVVDAVNRYSSVYEGYTACLQRVAHGDELVVEEVLSAAAMDAEMGEIAGIDNPTRHQVYAALALTRAELLGIDVDREWCAKTTPVQGAVDRCASF